MTARKPSRNAARVRTDRIGEALDRIAAVLPNGELLLATDQPEFFEAVAVALESVCKDGQDSPPIA